MTKQTPSFLSATTSSQNKITAKSPKSSTVVKELRSRVGLLKPLLRSSKSDLKRPGNPKQISSELKRPCKPKQIPAEQLDHSKHADRKNFFDQVCWILYQKLGEEIERSRPVFQ